MREKRRGVLKRRREFCDFACGLPALIFFAIFTYYPILYLLKISFTNWNLMKPTYQYVGLANYKWLTGNGWNKFLTSAGVTVLYTAGEVLITIIGGILLAVLFDCMNRMFKWMRAAIVIPKYVAVSSTAMIFLWLYNDRYGVFNYILSLFGGSGVNWLGQKSTALASLIAFGGWRTVGYAMLIYLSAMKGISEEYLEAAAIDGAGGLQKLRYIKIPLLAPTTLFLGVTTVVSSMKVFQAVDVLTGGGPYGSTDVLVYYIYELAFVNFRIDRAAAVGVMFFGALMLFTAVTMKWSNNKVNYDA